MADRPPAAQLRRIESRLNAILVLLSIGIALVLFFAARQTTSYWITYLVLIGVIAAVVGRRLVLGTLLTPSQDSTGDTSRGGC